jgi:hypothetical protein
MFENGPYPWLDPAYMGQLPVQPWTRSGILSPEFAWRTERHWELWQLLVHYGDQLQERMVEAALWVAADE